ncbi:fasciclin domain-containing protein [Sphingobacterium sp.]|uniref:fasciclin domain-containing protein n=1 Tax=Sphingobacterium sp. TaxID=341027 RepID=UPI00258CDC7D|nr:fasciclin domain-containing protein [Sphingobacterium sp.]WET67017.1 MAG: fasciclin domain-containing protein [Sphingobacterium sp.]
MKSEVLIIRPQIWCSLRLVGIKTKLLFFLLFGPFFFSACNNKDLDLYVESENYSNAADFVGNNYNLSLFYAALKQADLLDLLKQEGPFTLFAPNNKAFNDLGIVRTSDFASMNQDSLRHMLQYHILPRRLYSNDIPPNTIDNKYVNMADKELFIGYKYSKGCDGCLVQSDVYVNGAKSVVPTQNIVLANGVLHMIDKVLKYHTTVQDILQADSTYSLFVAFLKRTGNWERLAQPAYITVFAPNNEAFIKAGLTASAIANLNPMAYGKRLAQVYLLHNHFFLSDMRIYGQQPGSGYYGSPFYRARIVGDEGYYFGISSNPTMDVFIIHSQAPEPNNPIRISQFQPGYRTDHKADNGVVHGISSLLVLPEEAKINEQK